jgi:signal peptidase II
MKAASVDATGKEARSAGKAALFYGLVAAVLALDVATKVLVQRTLSLYEQRDVLGSFLRLTYIFNPGAAFGINLGPYSRWIFLALSVLVLAALFGMFAFTPAKDRLRIGAIGLVCGGALGNLVDRIKSENGVVDFLDVGIGATRWPVFNVADMALTVGAIILALSLWREEKRLVRGPERG